MVVEAETLLQRGEVWWVDFDERRPVVLLSSEDASGFWAMQVVAPADVDITGIAAEVSVGAADGLPLEGVLRVALPRAGFIPCTWLVALSRENLLERAGILTGAKLDEIVKLVRLGGLEHLLKQPIGQRELAPATQ